MTPVPVPLAIDFGRARAAVSAGGSLVNLYAQPTPEGAKDPWELIGTPGTSQFSQLYQDVSLTPETETHAAIELDGKLIIVGENEIYALEEDGSYALIGGGSGMSGPVVLASNGIDVAAVNGTIGRWINEISVTDMATDPDWYPASSVAFIDGYLVFDRQGTGQRFTTGLYTRDIDGLDIASAEQSPDPAVGQIRVGDNLVMFDTTTTEVWYNAAGQQFPFAPVPGATIEHGCAAIATAQQFDSVAYWLSNGGRVLRLVGSVPERISDAAIEAALKERREDWATARAFTYADEGHTFYILTVGDFTVGFDASTGLWHERQNYSRGAIIARWHAHIWGRDLIGDDQGRVLEMSRDFYDDAGEPIVGEIVTMPITNNRLLTRLGAFEIEMDTGGSALGEEWSIRLATTRDGGRSWSSERMQSIGKTGEYEKRIVWRKLGAYRDQRFRIRMSEPFPRRLLARAHVRF